MFTVTKNRLPTLINYLKRVQDPSRKQEILSKAASDTGQKLLAMFRQSAPDGSRWTEPTYQSPKGNTIDHGRPSKRIHGTILSGSWMPVEVEKVDSGSKFVVGTSTRQIEPLLTGAKPHYIPAAPTLITFFHFNSGEPMFFGRTPYERAGVKHPGMQANDFVSRTYNNQGRPLMISAFHKSLGQVLEPFYRFWGVKNV